MLGCPSLHQPFTNAKLATFSKFILEFLPHDTENKLHALALRKEKKKKFLMMCRMKIKGLLLCSPFPVLVSMANILLWRYFLSGQQGENRTTLVFFLGGVSYAEIAALRFLSQMEDSGMEYIIATTKLINGTIWIKSLMDRPESQTP